MKKCHACGASWEEALGAQPGKREVCAGCGANLHCCLNCRLYDPGVANQCLSRTVEPVREKEKANYCDEFEFQVNGAKKGFNSGKNDMEKKWGDLFK